MSTFQLLRVLRELSKDAESLASTVFWARTHSTVMNSVINPLNLRSNSLRDQREDNTTKMRTEEVLDQKEPLTNVVAEEEVVIEVSMMAKEFSMMVQKFSMIILLVSKLLIAVVRETDQVIEREDPTIIMIERVVISNTDMVLLKNAENQEKITIKDLMEEAVEMVSNS